MAEDEVDERVLHILSSLIAHKNRADARGWRDAFENMPVYLQRVELDTAISDLPVIHVAGTKGKGSTCAMLDSMLRQCGYRTGLFTSPHLVDVRERVRIDGHLVDKATFEHHFWWCYERFNKLATPEVGVPGYFRFITLLALKIFLHQHVDVAILEVGIGGRLDATNIIPAPIVCGITALGMDHMDMLGDTLPKIAGEKAGILKRGRPGLTVPQPEDALEVIKNTAARVQAPLQVVPSLDDLVPEHGEGPIVLGLGGEHQRFNAALAVHLCAKFEADRLASGKSTPGAQERLELLQQGKLPASYGVGLRTTTWLGRSTVVSDEEFAQPPLHVASSNGNGTAESSMHASQEKRAAESTASSSGGLQGQGHQVLEPPASRLMYFIDGAHTPESMVTCAQWYAQASTSSGFKPSTPEDVHHVLVFNCLKERDPALLLPELSSTLASSGISLSQAIFVPPESQYGALLTKKPPPSPVLPSASLTAHIAASKQQERHEQQQQQLKQQQEQQPQPQGLDYGWQLGLQAVWERHCLAHGHGRSLAGAVGSVPAFPAIPGLPAQDPARGAVSPSLGATLNWLRGVARSRPQQQLRVLVTGSLYLVGDVIRLLGRVPR